MKIYDLLLILLGLSAPWKVNALCMTIVVTCGSATTMLCSGVAHGAIASFVVTTIQRSGLGAMLTGAT